MPIAELIRRVTCASVTGPAVSISAMSRACAMRFVSEMTATVYSFRREASNLPPARSVLFGLVLVLVSLLAHELDGEAKLFAKPLHRVLADFGAGRFGK